MTRAEFRDVVLVTADRGAYLQIVGVPNSEEIIGKPERLVLSKQGKIPDFMEAPLAPIEEANEEVKEEKSAKKTTKKK